MQMDQDTFDTYADMIKVIESRELLMQISVSSYPHSSKNSYREKIHNTLKKDAYPPTENSNATVITTDELARILGGARG